MKIINKFILMGALALGIASCSSDKIDAPQAGTMKGDTHVGVTLTMALPNSTRALPNDYNHIGQWAGQDEIESIAIYVVDGTTVSAGQFNRGDFDVNAVQEGGSKSIAISPKKAVKTTPGAKQVYALINAPKEVVAHLATADASKFKEAYKESVLKLANAASEEEVSTSASKVAKVEKDQDKIVMTNTQEASLTVEDSVSEEQALAKSGAKNRAKITVQRAVARVMVTTLKDEFEIKGNDDKVIGKISDIRWVLAQGENSLYVQQKADFKTPAFDFISTGENYHTEAADKYDYSGLMEDYRTEGISGTATAKLSSYAALAEGTSKEEVLSSLNLTENSINGKFLLPTVHQYGADQSATGYRKGNTPYVLVRAKFTPAVMADGTSYTEGTDFYLGANGQFYASKENAQNVETNGVEGQKVARYINGKVLYYAWVNPDKVPGWLNSPVLRNHIYHVQIKGFKNIGTNWNPLVPTDPKDPNNPKYPHNPDPKPKDPNNPNQPDPDEPVNPIDPEDPLTVKETWMSVEMSVIPWEVHSYELELGI